jgi:hypothetical protein
MLGLRAQVIRDLANVWPLFDPDDPRSWERFAAAAATLLGERHGAAVALGARYYERLRVKRLPFAAPNEVTLPAIVLDAEHVGKSMAATGLVGTTLALTRGLDKTNARRNGFVRASMAASRLVLNGSRQAVIAAAAGDGRATGWTRVTGGKPCSWCASKSGVQMTSGEVFQAHDGCSCAAEPTWAE